jgi:hypothetical protein
MKSEVRNPKLEVRSPKEVTVAALACALGVWAGARVNVVAGQAGAPLRHAEIYQRATREFAEAVFLKPAEPKTNDLIFTLAPLILQEVNGDGARPAMQGAATSPPKEERVTAAPPGCARLDQFGRLSRSNGVWVLDPSRPAIYWQADTIQLKGKAHARFAYVWCYALSAGESGCLNPSGRSPGRAESGLALQGIRITLNSAGQPAIWEVLADSSGAEVLFVSRSLEAAALAEFGQPLPGRRYTIERGPEEVPEVTVARVVEDGPAAMGPVVYLSAGTRAVSTLICRCMAAQARKLLATGVYDLLPMQNGAADSLVTEAKARSKQPTAFWPGDDPRGERLEKCLRLPEAFSRPQGAGG